MVQLNIVFKFLIRVKNAAMPFNNSLSQPRLRDCDQVSPPSDRVKQTGETSLSGLQ